MNPLDKLIASTQRLQQILRQPAGGVSVSDNVTVRGSVLLERIEKDGSKSPLVYDPNLVVSLGRKAMSRLIGNGLSGALTLDKLTTPVIRVIRTNTGAPTSAWVQVETDGNDTVVSGWINGPTQEWSFRFVGGVYTISTLVAAINGVSNWKAEVIGYGTYDPVNLLRTPNSPCLGNAGSYSVVAGSPHCRVIHATISNTVSASVSGGDLYPTRIKFGTQGHQTASPSLGKDVLTTDEHLTAPLRPTDLGNAAEGQDYLPVTAITFPNSAQVSFYAELGNSQANGLSVSEVGLYTANHMIARKNFGQLSKTVTYGIAVTWTLVF